MLDHNSLPQIFFMYLDLGRKKSLVSRKLLPRGKEKQCVPEAPRVQEKISKEVEILITHRGAIGERGKGELRIEGLGVEGAQVGVIVDERCIRARKVSLYNQLVQR
jgi:hypothetical protein